MDYLNATELIQEAVSVAKRKSELSVIDMVIRGVLAGAFLGFATSLAFLVNAQGLPPIVGSILFPVGFVMLVLLGFELATGNFALLPVGLLAGQLRFSKLLRNWSWVYVGNLIGSVFYAYLFYLAVTNCGATGSGPIGDLLKQAAQKKTLAYMALGSNGWMTALVKGVLCNWMVTTGTVLALVSRSTIGKVVAMWLPILTFFAQGFEHSVVNMFVVPAGMMLGAPVSLKTWLFWNQLPVTLGNVIAGALFTGLALHATYRVKESPSNRSKKITPAATPEHQAVFAQSSGVAE